MTIHAVRYCVRNTVGNQIISEFAYILCNLSGRQAALIGESVKTIFSTSLSTDVVDILKAAKSYKSGQSFDDILAKSMTNL